MMQYLWLLFYAALAELARRCVLTLLVAYTGPLSKIPGPALNKFTGIPFQLLVSKGDLSMFPDLFQKYGDTVRLGPKRILLRGKDAVHYLLSENVQEKSPIYTGFRLHADFTDLFTEIDKDAHKQRRRMLSSGFSTSYLNNLEPTMMECVGVYQNFLEASCTEADESTAVDVFSTLANVTADVITATTFGKSWNLTVTNDTHLKDIVTKQLTALILHSQFGWLKYMPFAPRRDNPELEDKLDVVLAERRSLDEKDVKKDMLDALLATREKFPNNYLEGNLRADMRIMMIAGTDTTSVTTTMALLLLVNNQEKLDKLVVELDDAFPSRNDPITFEKTLHLPYLNAVLDESMRLMPALHSVGRLVTDTIMVNGFEVPPGTTISIDVYELGQDSSSWPDPDLFLPERWIAPYKGVTADRKASLPFSAGPRNCIGMQFAIRELRLLLAMMVRKFEVTLVPDQSHEVRYALTPSFVSGQYLVGMKPRK